MLQEGALQIHHHLPNSERSQLRYTSLVRGGMTQYDIRHDTAVAGEHEVHVMLGDVPIKGSPVTFAVLPDKPDPERCRLFAPTEEVMLLDKPYASLLRTYDKYGNACITGGHKFGTRLQLVKQSVHDQTALVPQNHTIDVADNQDGTYHILVTLNFSCAVKLCVCRPQHAPRCLADEISVTALTCDDARPCPQFCQHGQELAGRRWRIAASQPHLRQERVG